MFHPKLGSPQGVSISHEQVLGMLIGVAAGDRRSAPFRAVFAPGAIEHFSPLSPASEPSDQPLFPQRKRKRRKPKIDPLNPEYEDVDEADEGVPKDSELSTSSKPDSLGSVEPYQGPSSNSGGVWADKTQLTLAIMKSIVCEQGIDIYGIVDEHVNALTNALEDGTILSWPTTTRISIQSIALSNSIAEGEVREREFLLKHSIIPPRTAHITYFTSGNDSCLSDGFLPKLAPVAMFYATRDLDQYTSERKHWELQRIIAVTHTHPLAYVCGMVFVTFLERLLRMEEIENLGDHVTRQLILMELFSLATQLESEYDETEGYLSKGMSWIISNTESLEFPDLASRCQHSSRLCVNALLWTFGVFIIEGVSVEAIAATEACAMKSDARLSMILLIFGAIVGRKYIRRPYVDHLAQLDSLLETARQFYASIQLPTNTLPQDVVPAESLNYIEDDDSLVWAAPHRPNGPLIAEAFWFQPTWANISSFIHRFWRISGIKDFLIWITEPTPLKASALLLGLNYLIYLGATSFIQQGKAITAPKPPDFEHALHQRHYPVLHPSTGGESRSFKDRLSQM
jgi:ADP-ribosylglycohydrolase